MIRLLWGAACEVSSGAFALALAYHPGTWVVLKVRHLYGGHSGPAWGPGLLA